MVRYKQRQKSPPVCKHGKCQMIYTGLFAKQIIKIRAKKATILLLPFVKIDLEKPSFVPSNTFYPNWPLFHTHLYYINVYICIFCNVFKKQRELD